MNRATEVLAFLVNPEWWRVVLVLALIGLAYLQAKWLWRWLSRLAVMADLKACLHGSYELVVSALWLAFLLIEGSVLAGPADLGSWLQTPVAAAPVSLACLAYLAAVGVSGAACLALWRRYCAALPAEEASRRQHEVWLFVFRSQGAALCEELIFRLFLLNALYAALDGRYSPLGVASFAGFASAAAFGLFHWKSGQPAGARGSIYMFLGSVVGAAAALWSRSVWPAAILHGPLLGTLGFKWWTQQWAAARKQVGGHTPLFLLRARSWYFVTPLEGSRSWRLASAGASMALAIDKELVSNERPLELEPLREKYPLVHEPTVGVELWNASCAALFDPALLRRPDGEREKDGPASTGPLRTASPITRTQTLVKKKVPMQLDIHERDINSSLCRSCGACCRIMLRLKDTSTRYRRFLRQVGYTVLPPAAPDSLDCCNKKHDVTLDMGYCKHLEVKPKADGTSAFRCKIYGTSSFPELCGQFNCVSWAKSSDNYSPQNTLLAQAQSALDRQRAEGTAGR